MSQLPILILVLPMLLAPVLLILRNVGIMHSLVTIVLFINFSNYNFIPTRFECGKYIV